MKYLIAGLGNPDEKYINTRHNIGFMVADALARQKDADFSLERHAFTSTISHKGKKLHIIKPTTYMNYSGKAVNYWLQQLKISVENLIVITDDVALPFGKIRLRKKGSSGGHNGLAHIEEMLNTTKYPRLRFGVGDDYPKGKQIEYVLSPFSREQEETLEESIQDASDAILTACTQGFPKAMNLYN